jgi:hypothetical protein
MGRVRFECHPAANMVVQDGFGHAVSVGHAESDAVQARLVVNGKERRARVQI